MKIHIVIALSILMSVQVSAQTPNRGMADLALSAGPGSTFSAALSYSRLHPVLFKKKFHIGYGLRYTGYTAGENDYITAPAEVSEGNFFKKQNEEKLDTLTLTAGQVHSLNAAIYLMYAFNDKWSAGFNIDAVGFSFGGEQSGAFFSGSKGNAPSAQKATPTNFNLLLTGDYDKGSLNSEMYVGYMVHQKVKIRAGVTFLFSEYTTTQKLEFDNDRFRRKSLLGMLGVSYVL